MNGLILNLIRTLRGGFGSIASFRLSGSAASAIVIATLMALSAGPVNAADPYPVRPVRLIIPFPPGGGGDITGRLFGSDLEKRLGQPIVVDNRAGANGKIGVQAMMNSPKDGYTLLLATISTHATEPELHSAKPPYDPVNDFAPVVLINNMAMVLVTNPNVPVKNLAEFVALVKKNPGKLTYASAGIGNIGHLTMELFLHEAGLQMTHVPYKGAADAARDVVGHVVDSFFDVYPSELPLIKSGKVRGLAVSLPKRLALTPDIPTMQEAGYPNVVVSAWTGLVAPVGTPPEIIAKINAEANAVLGQAHLQGQLRDRGMVASEQNTPDQFKAFLLEENKKWSNLQRAIGLVR